MFVCVWDAYVRLSVSDADLCNHNLSGRIYA